MDSSSAASSFAAGAPFRAAGALAGAPPASVAVAVADAFFDAKREPGGVRALRGRESTTHVSCPVHPRTGSLTSPDLKG